MASILSNPVALLLYATSLLVCSGLLFARIEAEAPALYEELGQPRLFPQKNPFALYVFWRWLYTRPLAETLSTQTVVLAWLLRVLTPVYVIAFLVAAGT